jgi:uncharacterized damage-inducible protein DinB
MTPETARAMARYTAWMNDKLYAVAGKLDDAERKRDRGAFFKSIHGTLNHLMVADRVWLGRLTNVTPEPGFMAPGVRALDQELYADFAELRAERAALDAAILAYAETLTAELLAGEIEYRRGASTRRHPRWWAVLQLFNHGTHHRGQITTLLVQAGQDPGVTDVLAMLLEEQSR